MSAQQRPAPATGGRPGERSAAEGWAPLVAAGVLGPASQALLGRLAPVLGGLVPVHASGDVRLWVAAGADSTPYASSARERAFAWGHDLPRAGDSVGDVLALRDCAGLVVRPAQVLVHTGVVGLPDVYYREVGGAVCFATSIDPLVALGGGPLDMDWTAWAGILSTLHPLGRTTPFAQIRRLQGGEALDWDRARRRWSVQVRLPEAWTAVPAGTADAAAVARTLEEVVRARAPDRVDITLSGGWDSRAVLLALDRRRTDVCAWTTWTDDAQELDVPLATDLARRAGVTHEVVATDDRPWPADATWVRRRLEFQTPWHPWIARLAQRLATRDRVLLDGVGGDQVIKARLAGAAAGMREQTAGPVARVLRTLTVGLPSTALLGQGAFPWVVAARSEAWGEAVSSLTDLPIGPTLAVLRNRTSRGTGCSPTRLFGSGGPLLLPFLDADLLSATLAVPVADKADGRFYRAVLGALDPVLAALPSTNDKGIPRPGDRPVRQQSAAAVAATAALLGELGTVDGLLDDGFRRRLAADPNTTTAELLGTLRGRVWASGLGCLGEWLRVYRDRLTEVRVPWAA